MAFTVLPLRYQSQEIPFTEWISLLTLALAPLIAHVFVGAPTPSLLVASRPRWHDYTSLSNPAAIIYRYAAIADRRIRAYGWRSIDVAAANALFWTDHGWDGSEHMVTSSLPYCILLPENTTIRIFSSDMVKTVVITVQGLQAAISLTGALAQTIHAITTMPAIDFVFGPLSILGLLRLLASPWLVNDFSYSTRTFSTRTQDHAETAVQSRASLDSLLEHLDGFEDSENEERYRPSSYWASRLFRALYLLLLACLWFLSMSYSFLLSNFYATNHVYQYTTTVYFIVLFYFFTITVTLCCYAWYAVRGHTSTILPCASHRWFKAYTVIWLLLATALITISAVETYKTICGIYSSLPSAWADSACCGLPYVTTLNPNLSLTGSRRLFGLASQYNGTTGASTLEPGEFWVMNFTGSCMGGFENIELWDRVKILETVNSTNFGV